MAHFSKLYKASRDSYQFTSTTETEGATAFTWACIFNIPNLQTSAVHPCIPLMSTKTSSNYPCIFPLLHFHSFPFAAHTPLPFRHVRLPSVQKFRVSSCGLNQVVWTGPSVNLALLTPDIAICGISPLKVFNTPILCSFPKTEHILFLWNTINKGLRN